MSVDRRGFLAGVFGGVTAAGVLVKAQPQALEAWAPPALDKPLDLWTPPPLEPARAHCGDGASAAAETDARNIAAFGVPLVKREAE